MKKAFRFVVRGRVQGVGYRDFAQRSAQSRSVTGYARNQDDGSVEVYANGEEDALRELEAALRQGPRGADVWNVERADAEMLHYEGFSIRY